ncbi:hypothetical protein HK104_002721 [Borealophlyctis nickersoniae]|nr:hypothetical protein HK104_002721 [Borealophlyctis nickersoniae]
MTREDVDPLSAIVETLVTSVSELYADPAVSRKFVTRWRDIAKKESVPLHAPPAVSRVVKGAEALKLRDCSRFFEVEPDYYDWPLQKRAFRLMAPSTAHLCKSIIFENTRFKDTKDPYNSQYYCVLVQYVDKLNTQKLMNFVRDLSNKNVPKKHYNMRVAAEEVRS